MCSWHKRNKITHSLPWITIFCHSWGDSAMIFTRVFVTREIIAESPHSWQKKIVIHGNSCIILYILMQFLMSCGIHWYFILCDTCISVLQRVFRRCPTCVSHWAVTRLRFFIKCLHIAKPQWTHDVKIASLWRQNDVTTSFWRHNDVIIASCARWDTSCWCL